MVSTRLARVLVVALTVSATAQASWLAVPAEEAALVERQDTNSSSAGTDVSPTPSQSSPTAQSSTTSSTIQTTPSATPTQSNTVSTPTVNTSPTVNTTPTTSPPSTSAPSTSGPTTTSTTQPPKTTSFHPITGGQDTSSFSSFSTATSTTVEAVTTTDSAGLPITTSQTKISTQTYGLSVSDTDGGQSQGMSAQTRSTIIGVCVGVGGAIVLAVGGLMYWRLRNKRRQEVDHDELQSFGTPYGAPSTAEKNDNIGGARSPFQSTLESYHAPSQANTASNF